MENQIRPELLMKISAAVRLTSPTTAARYETHRNNEALGATVLHRTLALKNYSESSTKDGLFAWAESRLACFVIILQTSSFDDEGFSVFT